jgi:hypothetical protein
MRTILTVLALVALALTTDIRPGAAQNYPWCAQYGGGGLGGGGTNCGFSTWRQCMDAISGNGGLCSENPMYRPDSIDRRSLRDPRRLRI